MFSPEFLRGLKALYDNLYLNKKIVGTDVENARLVNNANTFAGLLQKRAIKENIDTFIMGVTEAEAVKLFANVYPTKKVLDFSVSASEKHINLAALKAPKCKTSMVDILLGRPMVMNVSWLWKTKRRVDIDAKTNQ